MRVVKRLINIFRKRLEQNRTRVGSWLVECMPSKFTALDSVPRTTENWALWEMLVISREVEAE